MEKNKHYRGCVNCIPIGIGKRIDDFCYQNDLPFYEFASRIGMDKKAFLRIVEGGENMNLSTAIKIANYMGCSLQYLVYGE